MEEDNVDVLYSDVKYIRNKKKANETDVSEAELTTYSEVNIRKARQNPEPSAVSQRVKPSPGSKVRVERVVLVIVCFLLIAALAALGVITCEYIKTKEMLRSEKVTCEADRANLTETLSKVKRCPTAPPPVCPTIPQEHQTLSKVKHCPTAPLPVCPTIPQEHQECSRCDPGWEPYGAKCYYFSVDRLTWEESKQLCMNLNGNLVKIDSRDEQTFLAEKVKTEMKGPEDKFWIGLTDVAIEGKWRWVDGSELDNDLRFWNGDEPDNWKGENGEYLDGEDCVRIGEKGENTVVNCWFDKLCRVPHRRICEKATESGKMELKCV